METLELMETIGMTETIGMIWGLLGIWVRYFNVTSVVQRCAYFCGVGYWSGRQCLVSLNLPTALLVISCYS